MVVRQYTGDDDDDDVAVEVVLGFVVLRGAIVASVVCFVEILILFDKCRNAEIVSWRQTFSIVPFRTTDNGFHSPVEFDACNL